jgi:predicted ATPase
MLLDNFDEAIRDLTYLIDELEYIPSSRVQIGRSYTPVLGQNNAFMRYLDAFMNINPEQLKEEMHFLQYWIKEFQLGEELLIEQSDDKERSIIYIKNSDGEKINITDLGYGYNQILPLLLGTTLIKRKNMIRIAGGNGPIIFCIEEPEANLHPNLQSKLADFLIDASYRFNIQFIIETHSEYLIRKLQYWVGKGLVSSQHAKIYYFDKEAKKGFYDMNLQSDGTFINDFGEGFFDESLKWKFELLKLKNQN